MSTESCMDITQSAFSPSFHDLFEAIQPNSVNRQRRYGDRLDFFGNYLSLSNVPEQSSAHVGNTKLHSESNDDPEAIDDDNNSSKNTDIPTVYAESHKSSTVLSVVYSQSNTPRSVSDNSLDHPESISSDISSPSNLAFQRRFVSQYKLWSPVLKTPDGTVSEKLYRTKLPSNDRERSSSLGSFSIHEKKFVYNDGSSKAGSSISQIPLLLPDNQTIYQKGSNSRRLSSITSRSLRNNSDNGSFSDISLTEGVPSLGCYCFVPDMYGIKPPSLAGHISHLINDKIYIYGGKCQNGISNRMYVVNCTTMKVDRVPIVCKHSSSPKLAYSASTVVDDRFIYIFGGQNENFEITNDFYVYDTKLSAMTKIILSEGCSQPSKRYGHSFICGEGNILYLFGGLESEDKFLGDIWSIDVSNLNLVDARFQKMHNEDMHELQAPQNRSFHSAHATGDGSKMVIYGGSGAQFKVFEDCWILDLEDHKWTKLKQTVVEKCHATSRRGRIFEPLDVTRSLHSSYLIGNNLVVVGGHDGKRLVNTVAILSLETQEWNIQNIHGVDMSGQYLHKMVYNDSRLLIVGGTSKQGLLPGIRVMEIPTAVFLENSI